MRDWSHRLRGGRGSFEAGRWRHRRRTQAAAPANGPTHLPDPSGQPLAAVLIPSLRDLLLAARPGLAIRAAGTGDIPGLRALVVADTEDALGPTVPATVQALMASLQLDGRRPIIGPARPETLDAVVTEGETIIGRIVIRRAEGRLRLVDLTILPDRRGQGLGTILLEAVTAAAADRGWPVQARLWYDSPAKRLFRKAGFVKAAETAVDEMLEWRPPHLPPA